ncbi:phage tail fiber protein [Pseudoalteromonas nigrifaciens]|uniref:phage tail fiber protein n=1 Tax=Pseudoalteromonas nigrifaciens TaxID=28109 RepID=UPI00356A5AF3
MTIQVPNPGTGNGATGDNEFVLWSKVKANFEDQTNAAGRLVGEGATNLSSNSSAKVNAERHHYYQRATETYKNDANNYQAGDYLYVNSVYVANLPASMTAGLISTHNMLSGNLLYQNAVAAATSSSTYGTTWFRHYYNGGWGTWIKSLSTANTTTDSNGFIKAASPIVKVFANKIECNEDAAQQDIMFIKKSVGDYILKSTSGLSTDGWYLELPKDLNGNPKVAVTLDETDGVISLKCYKRIFSMATFTFEPDLDEPLDVPDGRWIDLRLNEIPITDSVPLDEPIVPDSEV